MMSSEPIFDVLRGISTVASFSIAFNSVQSVWTEIFTGSCEHCMGAGIVICPRCAGTKTLRRRPANFSHTRLEVVDKEELKYPCIACGPNAQNDFDVEVEDDEERAWAVRDDLKLAMVNKPRLSDVSVYAGTVPCPDCKGSPVIQRHTPNLERFFGLEDPWQSKVMQRLGQMYVGAENRPPQRRRQLVEYPGVPPPLPESNLECGLRKEREKEEAKAARERENANSEDGTMSGRDQLTEDDFIIEYIDDSDTDVDG